MKNLVKILLAWYDQNKRDLPWRKTKDPYNIWLSEIIFQQTRIDQGLNYYRKFVEHYPDVHALSDASEEEVLKLWQGLGYYSRARNLHYTAQQIWKKMDGKFPTSFEDLQKLKGVGEYTAAAIASIAFNIPVPVVDGNVFRVITRLFSIKTPIDTAQGKKDVKEKMTQLISKERPGDFNQAMMEFGALYCKPVNPECENCSLKNYCKAYKNDLVKELPIKSKKVKVKNRYFHYLILRFKNNELLIRKRTASDIWKNLYDFPLIELESRSDQKAIFKSFEREFHIKLNRDELSISPEMIHVLTHRKLIVKFYCLEIVEKNNFDLKEYPDFKWVNKSQLNNLPFPRLILKYFQDHF